MAAEKAILVELTATFQKAVGFAQGRTEPRTASRQELLRSRGPRRHGRWLTCSWLVLRDTTVLDAKKPTRPDVHRLGRAPRLRAAGEIVMAANPVPLEAPFTALLG